MADVTVDNNVEGASFRKSVRSQIFISTTVGYQFFVSNADNDLKYRKTTDGGQTWGSAVTVRTGTIASFDLYADKDVIGDSGTKIHLTYTDSGTSDVYYRYLDTNGDSFGSEITVFNGASLTSTEAWSTICKARGGNLVIVYDIDGGTEHGAAKSADGSSWSGIADPTEAIEDFFILMPGNDTDNQDVWLLFWDRSANEISVKAYDDSGNSWSETSVSTSMNDQARTTNGNGWGAAVLSTGNVVLVAANDRDVSTADLKVWYISAGPTVTAKTNVITDADDWYNPAVFVDRTTDDVYVAYNGKSDGSETIGTSTSIYYKKSTDDAATWGTEQTYSASAANYRSVAVDQGGSNGRFIPAFFDATASDTFVNYDNSVAISGAVTETLDVSGGITPAGALALSALHFVSLGGSLTPAGDRISQTSKNLSGSVASSGTLETPIIPVFTPILPALSHVIVYDVDGTELVGELTPLKYKISRYQNRVGSWSVEVPVDEIVDGQPAAQKIAANYRISIYQDDNNPLNSPESGFLLYQGVVETREHRISAGGQSTLALTGSFRTLGMVRRSVRRSFTFDGSLSTLTNTLVGSYIDGDSAVIPSAASSVHVKGEFNDLSRYAAWIKGLTLGRYSVREGWDHDRPEITPYDGPPNPGVVIRKLYDDEDRYLHADGSTGVGLVAGEPVFKFDGSNLVNRVIAYGVDTVADPEGDPGDTMEADLTLGYATLSFPYPVKSGIDEGGNAFYYIEDSESIARYGLTEVTKIWTDIKNPNDLAASRAQAANVLYMTAVNELIKRRSEKNSFTIGPIANGARIWLLPGDQTWAQYQGEVETEDGEVVWLNTERRWLVTERHDTSDPSGIRRVELVLTAPEMEFPVPALPEVINPFDPDGPTIPDISFPPFPPFPELPGWDGSSPTGGEPCCSDPTTSKEEGPIDEPVFEGGSSPLTDAVDRPFASPSETGLVSSTGMSVGNLSGSQPSLLTVAVMSNVTDDTPPVPTLSSQVNGGASGMTFSQVETALFDSDHMRITLFVAEISAAAASWGSIEITATWSGDQVNPIMFASEIADATLDSIRQSVIAANSGPEDDDAVLLSANLLNDTVYTPDGVLFGTQPRFITVTITDTTPTITAGTVRIAGTDVFGAAQTEDISIAAGAGTYTSTYPFKTIASITTVGVETLDGSGDELIKVGVTADLALVWDMPVLTTSLLFSEAGMRPTSGFPTLVAGSGQSELLVTFPGPDGRGLGTAWLAQPNTQPKYLQWVIDPDGHVAGIGVELVGAG